MRVDYRYLRLASVPFYVVAVVLLVLVFVPQLNIVVGGSARWLKLGPLPAIHPAEIAKLALVIYLAHWFAKRGTRVRGFWAGTVPFLIIVAPDHRARLQGAGPRHDDGHHADRVHDVLRGRREPRPPRRRWRGARRLAMIVVGLHGYQLDRIRVWLDPWLDPLGDGLPHGPGAAGARRRRAVRDRPRGEPAVVRPERLQRLHLRRYRPGVRAGRRRSSSSRLFLLLAYSGIRVALGAPDTFGALLAAGITAWLCLQAFINIGVVVALLPITGITLPFISAGGSSLIISFAAVGILLSISRETVEQGDVERRCDC